MEVIVISLIRVFLNACDMAFGCHAIDGFLGQVSGNAFNDELCDSLRALTLKVFFPSEIFLMK